jgi:hypothetical protein
MLNFRQAYIATFNFLDSYYTETEDDTLGMLLGGMSPFTFIESESIKPNTCETADPAVWNDWVGVARKFTSEEQLDSKQTFQIMIEFLEFYETSFDYAPKWLIEDLKKDSYNINQWEMCINNSLKN